MKNLYCFWTGDNPMTENRLRGIQSLRETTEVNIVLVTNKNLPEYIVRDHPLHPGYHFLSCNHKSDYLRCYFMHFYGGGYTDIKPATSSWKGAFDKLETSDKWGLGYKEIGPHGVALVGGELYEQMVANWDKLIGCCAFIFKDQTPFTEEWYGQLMKLMDDNYDLLKANPGTIWEDPLPWTAVMGHIFHPLCLKHADHLLQDDSVKCDFSKDWR